MPSPRSLSNSFHLLFNLSSFSFSRSISVILVVFLVVILYIQSPGKCFPLNLIHSLEDSRFQLLVILSRYSVCQKFFPRPSRVFQKLFSVSFHCRPSFQKNYSSSHSNYRYPIISVHLSGILFSAHYLFVLLHLNILNHICSSNSSR